MEEKSQKTVVAFIAGLLIGGLLVWVFSISPDNKNASEKRSDTVAEVEEDADTAAEGEDTDAEAVTKTDAPQKAAEAASTVVEKGKGAITVDDQQSGKVVTIASLTMPVAKGWVVVHEINKDGTLSNILGAALYDADAGIKPTVVELVRGTIAETTYKVVIYGSDGNREFDKTKDVPVTTEGGYRIEDSFVTSK